MTVNPGDVVIGDADGVMVVPPQYLDAAIVNAEARMQKEANLKKGIDTGRPMFELMEMQAGFDAAGIEEIEGTWLDASGTNEG